MDSRVVDFIFARVDARMDKYMDQWRDRNLHPLNAHANACDNTRKKKKKKNLLKFMSNLCTKM